MQRDWNFNFFSNYFLKRPRPAPKRDHSCRFGPLTLKDLGQLPKWTIVVVLDCWSPRTGIVRFFTYPCWAPNEAEFILLMQLWFNKYSNAHPFIIEPLVGYQSTPLNVNIQTMRVILKRNKVIPMMGSQKRKLMHQCPTLRLMPMLRLKLYLE